MLLPQLEERKAENEAMCEDHREKIQQLWNRLQVPQEERELFNEHMVTSRKRNLEAVRRLKVSRVSPIYTFRLILIYSFHFSSVKSRGAASGGAQTAEHPQLHRRHPLRDRCVLGKVLLQHRPAAGFLSVL